MTSSVDALGERDARRRHAHEREHEEPGSTASEHRPPYEGHETGEKRTAHRSQGSDDPGALRSASTLALSAPRTDDRRIMERSERTPPAKKERDELLLLRGQRRHLDQPLARSPRGASKTSGGHRHTREPTEPRRRDPLNIAMARRPLSLSVTPSTSVPPSPAEAHGLVVGRSQASVPQPESPNDRRDRQGTPSSRPAVARTPGRPL